MNWDKIVIATSNRDKVTEIQHVLHDLPITILSINDLGNMPEVVEDQPSLRGNALKKAKEISKQFDLPVVSDDTGLEVDALDGAPGVYSSRFAGANATYEDNVTKLLQQLANVPPALRTARFRTVIAFGENGNFHTVEGVCEGEILRERRGNNGFGYDSVFFIPEYKKTLAEMSLEQKNKISHRAKALLNLKDMLKNKLGA